MNFVTTYRKGEEDTIAVTARKKFRSYGIPLHHRAIPYTGRHYSLGTPAFLLHQLQKGQPIVWVDVRTRFNGYPDSLPYPKNFDIVATEADERQTLHPTNFKLDPLFLLPTEQTFLLLKYWIAGCEDAGPDETWTDKNSSDWEWICCSCRELM
jgi:hypothetical protein